MLAEIRGSRSNKASVVVAVVNGTTSVSMAVDAGANFVLGKPVQDAQLRSLLDAAIPRMAREHRRYFRHKVDLPVELLCYTGETFAGKIINVSEDGLALTHFGPAAVEGVVTVQFGLPSSEPQTFQAKAAVVWNDASAMGLRFLRIEPGLSFMFRGLAGFPGSAAAIPRVAIRIVEDPPDFCYHAALTLRCCCRESLTDSHPRTGYR